MNEWMFGVGSLPCSERFFSGYSGFPLSLKTNISKFQFNQESDRRRTTLWMCYLQIIIYLVIYFIYLFNEWKNEWIVYWLNVIRTWPVYCLRKSIPMFGSSEVKSSSLANCFMFLTFGSLFCLRMLLLYG